MITAEQTRIAADRYLFPSEVKMIVVRQHPAALVPPIVRALGGLLVAWVVSGTILHNSEWLKVLVWVLWTVLLLQLLERMGRWAVNYFVVTSQRLLSISGTFPRRVYDVPLAKITDVGFERSFSGLLFGYGVLNIESPGSYQALRTVDYLPYPEQIYVELCELMYSDTEDRHGSPGSVGRTPD